MSTLKCKMCGGTLEINANQTVAVCEYCGIQQTLPKSADEVITNLFNRANNLRLKCEFDKAEKIYEKIVELDNTEAEAHWGIVLCKYGIEYVEDPKTLDRVPTCHRTLYDAVTTDAEYLCAIEFADMSQRVLYEKEARKIDDIQKGILAIVAGEKPFDVFICYKESDETGKRTVDSAIANDIYHQLTQEGFKVFYAPITLEDKLGHEYEPYIFAALTSSKVMLALATRPDYFNAVWVRNEWSRFMKLMKTDHSRLLIPCYRDMDAYELPEEFAHLQAQDMSKIGFINDVVRGIKKVITKDAPAPVKTVKEVVTASAPANIAPLLERAFMYLEDRDWKSADEYCEKVLDQDPKNARAYLGKLMASTHCSTVESLKDLKRPFDSNNNFEKIWRFGDDELKTKLTDYIKYINDRNELERLEGIYQSAKNSMRQALSEADFNKVAKLFESITGHRDSEALAESCRVKAKEAALEAIYNQACTEQRSGNKAALKHAIVIFKQIYDYKDSRVKIDECEKTIKEIEAEQERQKKLAEELAEEKRIQEAIEAKRNKKISTIIFIIFALGIAFGIFYTAFLEPFMAYNNAIKLANNGEYEAAITEFSKLDGFMDSEGNIANCKTSIKQEKYDNAVELMDSGKYEDAIDAFTDLGSFSDSKNMISVCQTAIKFGKYNNAIELMNSGKYEEAKKGI